MDKNKIKKGIGIVVLSSLLLGGAKGISVEAQIDHTEELCPYTKIFGYDHQIKAINRNNNLNASYEEVDNKPNGFIKETDSNGEEYYISRIAPTVKDRYVIPKGYKLEQNERGEDILVARNASGEIVSVLEPTVEKVVILPDGYDFDDNWMAVKKIPASKTEVITIRDENGELVNTLKLK